MTGNYYKSLIIYFIDYIVSYIAGLLYCLSVDDRVVDSFVRRHFEVIGRGRWPQCIGL